MSEINYGILGCASIARKNIRAILTSSNSTLVALASRDINKAKSFAEENGVDTNSCILYGSYEALLADPRVQAVYIPLPTALHLEWVCKAAIAKKHVLIDKPVAVRIEDMEKMLAVCAENNVHIMDGLMFMHHRRFYSLMAVLSDTLTGPVKRVQTSFSFNGDVDFLTNNIRMRAETEPLGALGDLGWYCIRLGVMAFSGVSPAILREPSKLGDAWRMLPVICSAKCSKWTADGVPLSCTATVGFSDPRSPASDPWEHSLYFECSFLLPFRQWFEICTIGNGKTFGDKLVRCEDYVIPELPSSASIRVESHPVGWALQDLDTRIVSTKEILTATDCCQEAEMFNDFSSIVSTGGGNVYMWQNVMRLTQAVTEACMESMRKEGSAIPIAFSFSKSV